jgi:hypothetical protein
MLLPKEIIAYLKALKLSSAADLIGVAARFRHIASTKWGNSSPNAIDSSALRCRLFARQELRSGCSGASKRNRTKYSSRSESLLVDSLFCD